MSDYLYNIDDYVCHSRERETVRVETGESVCPVSLLSVRLLLRRLRGDFDLVQLWPGLLGLLQPSTTSTKPGLASTRLVNKGSFGYNIHIIKLFQTFKFSNNI